MDSLGNGDGRRVRLSPRLVEPVKTYKLRLSLPIAIISLWACTDLPVWAKLILSGLSFTTLSYRRKQ